MNDSNKLYVDRVAPSVPEWYASMKYDPKHSIREEYINNSTNPYTNDYRFYTARDAITIKQQQNADAIYNNYQNNIRGQLINQMNNQWRNKVGFLL